MGKGAGGLPESSLNRAKLWATAEHLQRLAPVVNETSGLKRVAIDFLACSGSTLGMPIDVRRPACPRVSHNGSTEIWMNFAQTEAVLPDGSTMAPVSFQFRD
jgi:hypothetical protein